MIEYNYPVYIAIWFAVSLLTLWIFTAIPRRMKTTGDPATKSSMFTVMIFLGIPLAMIGVLSPFVFIIGDKNMASTYKIIWGVLAMVFIVYFALKQRTKKP